MVTDRPTPEDHAKAREVCGCGACKIPGWMDHNGECKAERIAQAIADARAEERGRCVRLVEDAGRWALLNEDA